MKAAIGIVAAILLAVTSSYGQIPSNTIGANPPELKWRTINTDAVRIVFPTEAEAQAQRVANIIAYLSDHHNETIGDKRKKVSIFFQNQTVIPNGLVTVGPFRSEFNLTSPQFNCPSDWVDLLAVHEYEHVKQFANSNRGITSVFKTLMGSWAWGGFAATALPRWFWEGDAVNTETALSNTGRGRMPAFTMEQRALVLDGIDYGYEKAAAGSLKDFVPDHYSLGYYMTAYGKGHFGRELWKGVLADAVSYKGLFFPLSRNLKKRTGLGTAGLYDAMRTELDSLWQDNGRSVAVSSSAMFNKATKRTVVHYSAPQWLDNGRLIVEKRGYDQIPSYVALDANGTETRVTMPGVLFGPPETTLSYAANRLAWAELAFDPRWSNRDYSVIRIYELNTRQKRTLTRQSKLFAPALSPDGNRVAAVEYAPSGACSLVILDAGDGRELQRLPNPEGYFYAYPNWGPQGDYLVVVAQKDEKHALHKIDLAAGQPVVLVPGRPAQLSHTAVGGEWVYFSAAYSGVNQVYAVKSDGTGLSAVTNAPIGAFQPAVSPDGKNLAYSEFSSRGFNVMTMPLDPDAFTPADLSAVEPLPTYAEALSRQEGGSILPEMTNRSFEVKKFNRLSGIINPHSWLPVLDPPLYGARILSDNRFSTLSMEGSALYNDNEKEWSYSGTLSYAEWFPIINLSYTDQHRSGNQLVFTPENDSTVIFSSYNERWRENKWTAGVHVPLNFSKGNVFQRIDVLANSDFIDVDAEGRFDRPGNFRDTLNVGKGGVNRLTDLFKEPIEDGQFNTLDLRLRWILYQRQAVQFLNPKWGMLADFRYRTAMGSERFRGDNLLIRSDLYFPGLARNHSFYINLAYQQNDLLDNYRFPDFFPYPRGYDGLLGTRVFKAGANYSLPLAYPDLAIGPLAFVKRIKVNGFFDYGRRENDSPFTGSNQFSSTGLELRFDVRLLRLVEADLGLRYSYLLNAAYAPQGQVHQFDFLVISISN
ncbi:MAG: PD40 domain-containing protein [Lewinellaceae bacterium]|nr:PD40 domain-containing protein [Lewinellaceae bacterium]